MILPYVALFPVHRWWSAQDAELAGNSERHHVVAVNNWPMASRPRNPASWAWTQKVISWYEAQSFRENGAGDGALKPLV